MKYLQAIRKKEAVVNTVVKIAIAQEQKSESAGS